MDKIVFWSENHFLMTLTSCYLFRQYKWQLLQQQQASNNEIAEAYDQLNNSLETKLLLKYLKVHCHEKFGGLYETNSFVYFPYTMSALLNLFDFSSDLAVRNLAKTVLDNGVYRIMLGTTPLNGVCNLTGYNCCCCCFVVVVVLLLCYCLLVVLLSLMLLLLLFLLLLFLLFLSLIIFV